MDIFNPNHYIPRLYLEEQEHPAKLLDMANINFYFQNSNPYNIPLDFLENNSKNIYMAHELSKDNISFNFNNDKHILKFVSGKKGHFNTEINFSGDNILVLENEAFTEQLIYHSIKLNLNEDASLKLFIYTHKENSSKIKNNINVVLSKMSNIEINAFSLVGEKQYQDDSIQVEHAQDSNSVINYRSFTDGFTVSQVNSIIPVHATNSNTEQHLKHTMMKEGAKIFSKPNLEISNPNVTAGHGNSIGTISDEDLQYLAFRGINPQTANLLIVKNETETFLNNIIQAFTDDT